MQQKTFNHQILEALETGSQLFASLSDEAREQMRAALEAQLEQMEVVTRAEFDALRQSLARADQRIAELEKLLENQKD